MSSQTFSVRTRAGNSLFYRTQPAQLAINADATQVSVAEYALPVRSLHVAPGLGRHELVLTTPRVVLSVLPVPGQEADWPTVKHALTLATIAPKGFIFQEEIGRGAFGVVYKAVCRDSGKVVAVKDVRKSLLRERNCSLDVARRELAILDRLPNHDNIVAVHQTFETRRSLFVVMEYVAAGSMLDVVVDKSLPFDDVRDVMGQLLSAVAHLHQHGVIHRDIKLDNVLVSHHNGFQVKLCDFGLAVEERHVIGKRMSSKVGTGYAQAPEMVLANSIAASYDRSVDVWACGIVLFCLLYSRIPWLYDPEARSAEMRRMVQYCQDNKPSIQVIQTVDERLKTPKHLNSLLCGLLQPVPQRRLSAQGALVHPVFETRTSQSMHALRKDFGNHRPSLRNVANHIMSVVRVVEKLQNETQMPPSPKGVMML